MNKNIFLISLKTTIAVTIAYIIGLFLPAPYQEWMIVTTVVVMSSQVSIGAVKIKSTFRLVATVIAILIALISIKTLDNNIIAFAFVIAISVFGFTYYANLDKQKSYIGVVGAFTIGIALAHNNPTILFAINRILEVLFGIIISFLVGYFIFPIKAKSLFNDEVVKCLNSILIYIDDNNKDGSEFDFHLSFNKQKIYINEIKSESKKKSRPLLQKYYTDINSNLMSIFKHSFILIDYMEYKISHNSFDNKNKNEILKKLIDYINNTKSKFDTKHSYNFEVFPNFKDMQNPYDDLFLNYTFNLLKEDFNSINTNLNKLAKYEI